MSQREGNVIGILSGMGPHAGLDLAEKILEETVAHEDQEHLPVALLSYPERIVDRSTWLFDETQPTPVPALARIALQIDDAGAVVIGMPCNTAHDPRIFNAIQQRLIDKERRARLVHMLEVTAEAIRERHPGVERVGILSSLAVYRFELYRTVLEEAGFEVIRPNPETAEQIVNPVIFDTEWGIKAKSQPVTDRARDHLLTASRELRDSGAELVVLGCTEFPLALPDGTAAGLPTIDPTRVLARALIRETAPEKLAPVPADPSAV